MGWNSTTKIMTAPLNINALGDIEQAVQHNSGDLGACIQSGTINKWAKYKPVRFDKLPPLTEAELKSVNYGLVITKYDSISTLTAGIAAGTDWQYQRPRGISAGVYSEPFRFFDFINATSPSSTGYRGDANCFLASVDSISAYTQGTGGLVFRANWNKSVNLKTGSIAITDLTDVNGSDINLSSMYFGMLMVKGTSYVYLTSTNTIGDSNYITEIEIPASTADGLSTGSWSLYFLIAFTQCSTAQTNSGTINSTYLRQGAYSLPDIGARTITIRAAATLASASIEDGDAGVSAVIGAGRFTVSFDIAYKASSSSQYIYVRYKIYGGDAYGEKTTLYIDHEPITLQATTTKQLYSVLETFLRSTPAYVTVELTYTIGTSATIYQATDASVRVEEPAEP